MGETISDWVRAAQLGEACAFQRLVGRYRPIALTLARTIVDPDLAEDAVQDSVLIALRSIGQLDEPEQFPAWFAAIVRNRCKRLARNDVKAVSLEALGALNLPPVAALTHPPPELPWPQSGWALESLPQGLRELVVLYYQDGYSVGEISNYLSLPATTIKWQLHAARALLKRKLEQEGTR